MSHEELLEKLGEAGFRMEDVQDLFDLILEDEELRIPSVYESDPDLFQHSRAI